VPCPYCAAPTTSQMARRTTLGYRMFRCRACRRTCNERTGTPFNHLQAPTDSAVLVVLWRLQDKLSLRNWPRWSSRGAAPSPMRRYETGRNVLLLCSPHG